MLAPPRWLTHAADRARDRWRRSHLDPDLAAGHRGEDLAHRFLEHHGYQVVARNYRPSTGGGELDLVAWHGDVLVVVEVKSRRTADYGAPETAVDLTKQIHLIRAARDYARRANVAWERVRFDIVSVIQSEPPQLELHRDAFSANSPLR